MAAGMAGHEKNLSLGGTHLTAIALARLRVNAGNAARIIGGADNPAAGLLLNLAIAAHVIMVMMGIEDQADAPAESFRLFQHRSGHCRIDDSRLAAFRAMREIDVVIPEDGNLMNLESAHNP